MARKNLNITLLIVLSAIVIGTFIIWMADWITSAKALTFYLFLFITVIITIFTRLPREKIPIKYSKSQPKEGLESRLEIKYNQLLRIHDNAINLFKHALWILGVLIIAGTYMGFTQLTQSKSLLTNLKGTISELHSLHLASSSLTSKIESWKRFTDYELTRLSQDIDSSIPNSSPGISPLNWISLGEFIARTKEISLLFKKIETQTVPRLQEALYQGSIDQNKFKKKSGLILDFLKALDQYLTLPESNDEVKKEKYIKIAEKLEKIINSDPDFIEARELLGQVYLQKLLFTDELYKKRADSFFAKLEKRIDKEQEKYGGEFKNLALYYQLRHLFFTHDSQDLHKAKNFYNQGILWKPNEDGENERILHNLALVHIFLGEESKEAEKLNLYKTAINYYQKSLKLNPYSAAVHNDLAWLYSTASDWDPKKRTNYGEYGRIAIDHAEKAVRFAKLPGGYNYFIYQGTLAKALKNFKYYKKALLTLNEAIQLGKVNENDFKSQPTFMTYMDRYRKRRKNILVNARQYYEKVCKTGDESPTIHANLGYFYKLSVYVANEEEEEGNMDIARAIVFGNDKCENSEKAYILKKREFHQSVTDLYEKAINCQESVVETTIRSSIDPEWFLYLGINLYFDENYKELKFNHSREHDRWLLSRIREYYHLALKEDRNYAKAINNLAWLYSNEGKDIFKCCSFAIELAEKAAEITEWKDFEYQVHTLAEALRESGDIDRAIGIIQYAFFRNSWSKEYMEKPFELKSGWTNPIKYLQELRK